MQPTNVEENDVVAPTIDVPRTAAEAIAEADRIQLNLVPGRASTWEGTTAVSDHSCRRPCRSQNGDGAKDDVGVSRSSKDAKVTGTATGPSGVKLPSLETVLADAEYVALRRSDAMDDFLRRRGGGKDRRCDANKDAVKDLGTPDQRRTLPLCYVVGPSSADRTHFALQNLKDFHNHAGLPSVLVHWPLWKWHVPNRRVDGATAGGSSIDKRYHKAALDLVRCFGQLLAYRIQFTYDRKWNPRTNPLKLHLCLVLDVNEEQPEQIQFFSHAPSVAWFVKTLEESYVAESILVVICAPRNVAAANDAFVFQLDGTGILKR